MNINASIVDQQLSGLLAKHPETFAGDEVKQRSTAFVIHCMMHLLSISFEEASDLLTDGADDAGIDGISIGDVDDGEFSVTVFQAKYKHKDLSGSANFPASSIEMVCGTVRSLFDPSRKVHVNPRLEAKLAEVRSLILDSYLPRVTVVLCNNGAKWNAAAENVIQTARQELDKQVDFVHFNHDDIVGIQRRVRPIDTKIQLHGQLIVEDQNMLRVMVGRVHVAQIAALYEEYGDRLLQRNIRRYLGLRENRVNSAIYDTLRSDNADKFYFHNNGLTIACDRFDYNAFQQSDHMVRLANLQVINGGQTCRTIYEALRDMAPEAIPQAYVMVRIYQTAGEEADFVQNITYATNSQNPVDLRDLRSNDVFQKNLEIGLKDLGWQYKRQRDESVTGSQTLTSAMVAEAVLSVWREQPHHARFLRRELFGRLYETIFNGLSASQALVAALIFREVENRRRRGGDAPRFVPYASQYLSMLVGRALLAESCRTVDNLTHRNVKDVLAQFEEHKDDYYAAALSRIAAVLSDSKGGQEPSLQQLSATFRRGELLEKLKQVNR